MKVPPGPAAARQAAHETRRRPVGTGDRVPPANPPATPIPGVEPGAAGPILQEVQRRLETQLGAQAASSGRDPAERLEHMHWLIAVVIKCRRTGLPYKNALIGLAVQAVAWAAVLEDET